MLATGLEIGSIRRERQNIVVTKCLFSTSKELRRMSLVWKGGRKSKRNDLKIDFYCRHTFTILWIMDVKSTVVNDVFIYLN